jgi:hypothetical protein
VGGGAAGGGAVGGGAAGAVSSDGRVGSERMAGEGAVE